MLHASGTSIAHNERSVCVQYMNIHCASSTSHHSLVSLIYVTPQPDFNPASLRGMTAETLRTYLTRDIPGGGKHLVYDMKMPEFDGRQDMEISYVRVLEVVKRVFSDPPQASKMQYHPKSDFTLGGERRYGTFSSGAMWELKCAKGGGGG